MLFRNGGFALECQRIGARRTDSASDVRKSFALNRGDDPRARTDRGPEAGVRTDTPQSTALA